MCLIKHSNNLVIYILSSMWLYVNVRTASKKACEKEIGFHAQSTLTIPGSIVNMIGGDLHDQLRSRKILTFDNQ